MTKLLWLAWVLVAAFLLPALVLVLLMAGLLVIATSARALGWVVRSLRIPAVLVVSILVMNALLFPGGEDVLVEVGPIRLTSEGITFGLMSAGRLLVAFMASVLFLLTTLPDDLLESLVRLGVSHRIAYVVLSAVQLVPRLQDRAAAILGAQQARGLTLTGSLRSRLRALIPLVGPILLGSLIDVRERTFALEARAFGSGGRRTAYRHVVDSPIDRWLRWLAMVAIAATVVVALTGIGR